MPSRGLRNENYLNLKTGILDGWMPDDKESGECMETAQGMIECKRDNGQVSNAQRKFRGITPGRIEAKLNYLADREDPSFDLDSGAPC